MLSLSHVSLCDPRAYSPPGSSVHGILQARKLEWVAMPSSRRSSRHFLHLLALQVDSSPPSHQANKVGEKMVKVGEEETARKR